MSRRKKTAHAFPLVVAASAKSFWMLYQEVQAQGAAVDTE
jgi:hypothetical protein